MSNIWAIKINASNCPDFERVLQKSLNDKSIGIGFGLHVPYNLTTKQQRKNIWENNFLNERQVNYRERMFDILMNKIALGDTIFLCKGKDKILYKATISGDYYYDSSYLINSKSGVIGLPHRIKIKNITKFTAKVNDWNHTQTIYKL